jgi:DNA-binding transcriptional LysR family regulator
MDKLRALTYFVACAEEGSFAGASRKLEVSGPAIHKLVALLEASVGIRLFERSVRGLALADGATSSLQRMSLMGPKLATTTRP